MTMKTGIDSYSYHRYFGEVYDTQKDPGRRMSYEDFLRRAMQLEVDGVSLETCFLESLEESYLRKLKEITDRGNLEVVVAWGHPDGYEGGKNPGASEDLTKHFRTCEILGATVMRIVGSSLSFRNEPRRPQITSLIRLLKEPAKIASDNGIRLAMENHFDFTADEILEILQGVNSDSLGVTYDTGNSFRIGDDPVEAARKMAPHIFATHVKDVAKVGDVDPEEWYHYASVPLGEGVVDIEGIARALIDTGYRGLFAVEIDYLHPGCEDEDITVEKSIKYLKSLKV